MNAKALTQTKLSTSLDKMNGLATLIDKNLHRASSLVQSFKQVAVDQSSEQARDVKMKTLLEEIVTSLEPQLKKGKHLVNIHCERDLTITTIPGYWSQVLFNLINNSLIHGFAQQQEKIIDITLKKQNSSLILQYKDNGVGLSETCKKNIFEPFYTTKRNEGGAGLGMHLVFNIVTQAIKGDIELVESNNQGAAFKITISSF